MRRWLLPVFISGFLHTMVLSQDKTFIQDPTLSVSFLFNDFRSAAAIRASSLKTAIRNNQFGIIKEMSPGLGLSYLEGLSKHIDVTINLAGSFLDYPVENRPSFNKDYFLVEADVALRGKMFSNKHWISPYLMLGTGSSFYNGYYAAYIPAGMGMQVNFFDEAYLLVNAQYRIPVTAMASYHFFYSIGLAGNIGRKKINRVAERMPMPVRQLYSQPDRDGDGVPDSDDICPDTRGSQKYKGCPVPDTDGDGINDEADKCPAQAGPASNNGCPVARSTDR